MISGQIALLNIYLAGLQITMISDELQKAFTDVTVGERSTYAIVASGKPLSSTGIRKKISFSFLSSSSGASSGNTSTDQKSQHLAAKPSLPQGTCQSSRDGTRTYETFPFNPYLYTNRRNHFVSPRFTEECVYSEKILPQHRHLEVPYRRGHQHVDFARLTPSASREVWTPLVDASSAMSAENGVRGMTGHSEPHLDVAALVAVPIKMPSLIALITYDRDLARVLTSVDRH